MAGVGVRVNLALLLSMIIQHHIHIITHYKYVRNALQMHALSEE